MSMTALSTFKMCMTEGKCEGCSYETVGTTQATCEALAKDLIKEVEDGMRDMKLPAALEIFSDIEKEMNKSSDIVFQTLEGENFPVDVREVWRFIDWYGGVLRRRYGEGSV